jgi:hypothetical protein
MVVVCGGERVRLLMEEPTIEGQILDYLLFGAGFKIRWLTEFWFFRGDFTSPFSYYSFLFFIFISFVTPMY